MALTGNSAGADPALTATSNRLIFEETRRFAAPDGLLQFPRVETGTEVFDITVPDGLKLSLVDLATPQSSILAGAEVTDRPTRGVEGSQRVSVDWSYPVPTGSLEFTLRVYASPDGTPPAVTAPVNEPGSNKRLENLIAQNAPVDLAIQGPIAEQFKRQILDRGGQIIGRSDDQYARALVDPTTTSIIVAIAVVAAVCIVLGFVVFGAVLFMAMEKGYNIDDAGYKVAVGEGQSRQEHQMVFKIRKPEA